MCALTLGIECIEKSKTVLIFKTSYGFGKFQVKYTTWCVTQNPLIVEQNGCYSVAELLFS